MKKQIFIFLFLLTLLTSIILVGFRVNNEKYYYSFNDKIYIKTIDGKFLVQFTTEEQVNKEVVRLQLLFNKTEIERKDRFSLILKNTDLTKNEDLKDQLKKSSGLRFIKPIYSLIDEDLELIATNEIIVKFKDNISKEKMDSIKMFYSLKIKTKNKVYDLYVAPDDSDVLEIANKYQESGLVEFAHPNFTAKIQFSQSIPNDPYFSNQFYLNNTGQTFNGHIGTANADINAPEVWDITVGCNAVTVAVLDQGVTSNHIDLPNTRQVRLTGSNFGDGNPDDPSPTNNDNHGNSCAGIIAA